MPPEATPWDEAQWELIEVKHNWLGHLKYEQHRESGHYRLTDMATGRSQVFKSDKALTLWLLKRGQRRHKQHKAESN